MPLTRYHKMEIPQNCSPNNHNTQSILWRWRRWRAELYLWAASTKHK